MTPRRTGRTKHLDTALRLVIVTVVAAVVSFHSVPQAKAQDAEGSALEIDGSGAFELTGLVNAWASPMFKSGSPVNLSYVPGGDTAGRSQLALGQVDFAISGRPLSADDTAALAARNTDVIEAPLAMAATAFVYESPAVSGLKSFTPDPADPENSGTTTVVNQVHIPPAALSQVVSGEESYNLYNDPTFLAGLDLPTGAQFFTPQLAQQAIARSDPGAANYYLGVYILKFAPAAYNAHLQQQNLPAGVQSENWPFLDMASRAGPKPTSDLLSSGQLPSGSNDALGGAFGQLDQTTAVSIVAAQTAQRSGADLLVGAPKRLSILPLLNGAGEWVTPTPASITAAGAAGGGTPLYGLTENSTGVYPFAWVTNLDVPATGLSVEKTNAIATFLRYATGPGQDLAAGVNDGVLPDSLRSEAADKADEIVKGNCKAAGGTTTTDKTGGPYWPDGVAVPKGGTLLCVAPDGPTTTVAPGATSAGGSSNGSSGFGPTSFSSASGGSSGSYGSSGGSSGDSSGSGLGEGSGSGASGGSGAAGGSGDGSGSTALSATAARVDLPLPLPDDGQFELDRFATIILGGLFFLLVRSIVRPRLVGSS